MAMIIGHSQTKYLKSSTLCPVFPNPGFKVKDFMRGHLEFYKQLCQKSVSSFYSNSFVHIIRSFISYLHQIIIIYLKCISIVIVLYTLAPFHKRKSERFIKKTYATTCYEFVSSNVKVTHGLGCRSVRTYGRLSYFTSSQIFQNKKKTILSAFSTKEA